MNKIYLHILGALAYLNAMACSAADMFEVLPDLPDPLSYAVQPASASTISGATDTAATIGGHSIGAEPSFISVLLTLLFVILLIYLTGIFYAKLNKVNMRTMKKQQGELAKSQVSVVSTTQLGNNKTLHVVELDGKRMLIGASSSAIQLIKDLGSVSSEDFDEEYSRIEIPNIKIPKIEIPKIEIPSIGFSKIVTKAHKGLKDIENNKPEDCVPEPKEEIKDEVKEGIKDEVKEGIKDEVKEEIKDDEITSEGIIDSLFVQPSVHDDDITQDNPAQEHVVDPDDFALYKKYLD